MGFVFISLFRGFEMMDGLSHHLASFPLSVRRPSPHTHFRSQATKTMATEDGKMSSSEEMKRFEVIYAGAMGGVGLADSLILFTFSLKG